MNTKLSIFALLLCSMNLMSQDNNLIVRLGMTSMYVTESAGSISANYSNKIGLSAAVGFELGLSKYLAIQPEINSNSKGYEFNQNGQSINMKLSYIELPLLLKGRLPIEDFLELYGEAGPSFAVGIGGNALVNGVEYSDVFGSNGFNRVDFGLNIGGGANYKLTKKMKLGLNYRVFRGLGELYPNNPQNISGKNNGFIIGLNFAQSI